MQISEISSGDSAASESSINQCSGIIQRIEKSVRDVERMAPVVTSDTIQQLRNLSSLLPVLLSQDQRLCLWKLSYRIWNTCVSIANMTPSGQGIDEDHAKLRQIASDMLLVAGSLESVSSSWLKMAMFFYRTGVIWHKLTNYANASLCFEKATELSCKDKEERGGDTSFDTKEDGYFLFDLYITRAKTEWELSHRPLACSLLGRARSLLSVLEPHMRQELAEQYLQIGKSLLTKPDKQSQAESIKYMEQAFEICSEALSNGEVQIAELEPFNVLRTKVLRYLAGGHLQNDNFENVLKCVTILKGAPDHPSTPFLALKAFVGLNRFEEAEKELYTLIANNATPVDICISAMEIIAQSINQLDAVQKAFFLLLARFPANKEMVVRVLEKLLRQPSLNLSDQKKRVEAALNIALDEKVVATISSLEVSLPSSANQSITKTMPHCVFALMWNSASDFFQAKDYRTSIKLFEGSMLYLLPTEEQASQLRAKCLRVLCLCHMGLAEYDRASEYIAEAEKVEPNVTSAFLKFKICLQTNDECGAAKEIEKMNKYPDFEPDYLTLASHEAIASKCFKVATCALSSMIDLFSSARPSHIKEVEIVRNLILLSLQDSNNQTGALKYLQHAQARLAENGFERFFGPGSTGEKEANWFAGLSWNQGLVTSKSENWTLCADFFACASDFYGCLPDSLENLQMRRTSLLLHVAAILASERNNESELKSAVVHLEKCCKVQSTIASKSPLNPECHKYDIYPNLLAFDLKGRLKDHNGQLEILYHCSSLQGFKAEYFWMMASHACENSSKGPSVQVAMEAFRACLNLTLSSAAPDYKMVAAIVRKLITLTDFQNRDGPETSSLYQQANQILLGLNDGDYPKDEVQWLVSTSWNRAALHVKFSRYGEAERWMSIALDLLKHAPFMESHRSTMLENLTEVLKAKAKELAIIATK